MYNRKEINAEAVLDSGAEGLYCNTSFIKKYSLPTCDIELPVYPRNIDGTLDKQGAIRHAAILRMGIGARHWENIEVTITNTGRHKILLGTDWLKAHNPSINWSTNRLHFDRCPPQCHSIEQDPMIRQFLPIDAWETQNDDYLDYTDHGTDALQCIVAHKVHYFEPMIRKTTVSRPTTVMIVARQRRCTWGGGNWQEDRGGLCRELRAQGRAELVGAQL